MNAIISIDRFSNDVIATSNALLCSQYDVLHYLVTQLNNPDAPASVRKDYSVEVYEYTDAGRAAEATETIHWSPAIGGSFIVGSYYTVVGTVPVRCDQQNHGV